ncbi:MAG: hypothetical protein CW342_03625 [Thermoactinomycetaceae bacterium]|nr:hypothetical protein [Bacillota bacterium]MBO2531971.1 hypothetical protein [Thermoactinomycetaceae bacterium]
MYEDDGLPHSGRTIRILCPVRALKAGIFAMLIREGSGPMFFHGIPFIYLVRQYPVLNPASSFRNKSPAKRADARRLIRTIGFEPVHLLRSSPSYPIRRCLEACFRYGEVVFAFESIPYPRVQLSEHEWGVRTLDLRRAAWVIISGKKHRCWFRSRFPHLPVAFW